MKLSSKGVTFVCPSFDKPMKLRQLRDRLLLQEDLNFLLTNRVPRIALTRLMGWYSRIESPWLTRLSIAIWRMFTDLDLSESRQSRFNSLRECFIRELKPGVRPIDHDPRWLTSPCDGIIGAHGQLQGIEALQAKGMPYPLGALLGDQALAQRYADGRYLTLRLTSSMYHRFHAPAALSVQRVTYISGDTWNVNPIALKRIERLFCRNERAVIECLLDNGQDSIVLVPVAAILVASMRLSFADVLLHLRYRGANPIPCQARLDKGQTMGWFEHGSTIIVLLPAGYEFAPGLTEGDTIRMGERLVRRQG